MLSPGAEGVNLFPSSEFRVLSYESHGRIVFSSGSEAPRPQGGASRRGSFLHIVPLPACRQGPHLSRLSGTGHVPAKDIGATGLRNYETTVSELTTFQGNFSASLPGWDVVISLTPSPRSVGFFPG